MGETTGISWTDATLNFWIGCTKVSPGCANCYAAAYDKRWGGKRWGKGAPRTLTSEANRRKPLAWNRKAAALGKRMRVFCSSLADVFDPEVPDRWRTELLDLIRRTPMLDWQLLTKRPHLIRPLLARAIGCCIPSTEDRFDETLLMVSDWIAGWKPPANVWLGTTVEDQQRADERIPHLLAVPAAIRFLSVEPQLGPVNLADAIAFNAPQFGVAHLDWCIQGGESGPKARPFDLAWARDLRDQCAAAGVAYFFKQAGARCVMPGVEYAASIPIGIECEHGFDVCPKCDAGPRERRFVDRAGADPAEWPADLRIQNFPEVRP